jgi:hypothetical protein
LKDVAQMRKTAVEFRAAQVAARQQAIDTIAACGKYDEYAKKKQAQAAQQKTELAGVKQEAGTAGNAAQQGQGNSAQTAGHQNQASQSAQNQPKPDVPRPSGGGWFGAILNAIKNWAIDKFQRAMAFVQQKIADVVMRLLCGVSMDDMTAYSAALHRRMDYSKQVSDQGTATSTQVHDTGVKLSGDALGLAATAVAQANDCDQNIADAEKFLTDLDSTEAELHQEVARANQFLSQMKQEVEAEKKRRADEEAKEARDEQQALHHHGKPTGTKPEVDPNDVSKVHGAASYVATQTQTATQLLQNSQRDQSAGLHDALAGHSKDAAQYYQAGHVGQSVVDQFRGMAAQIHGDMQGAQGASITTAAQLDQVVQRIRSGAQALDQDTDAANQALDASFTAAYNSVSQTQAASKYGG